MYGRKAVDNLLWRSKLEFRFFFFFFFFSSCETSRGMTILGMSFNTEHQS